MRIAVISDTHDRTFHVESAVKMMYDRGVDMILHCGDIESVETVRLFVGIPSHFVFGNWDGDWIQGVRCGWAEKSPNGRNRDDTRLRRAIQEIGGVLHEPFGDLDIDGCKLAWTHGNDREMLRELEYCDYFDFLFHGHTHVARQRRRGKTLIANPGALFRASQKTFAILDLSTRTLETIEVHDDE